MDLISYLRVLRRRWVILVVPMIAAVAIAWFTLPDTPQQTTPAATSYTATATLIKNPTDTTNNGAGLDLSTVALFATVGDVPKDVAKRLDYPGEPQILASQVTITPVTDNGTLTIGSTDSDAKTVVSRVNAFADATVAYFREKARDDARAQIRAGQDQIKSLTSQLKDTQRQLATNPEDAVEQAQLQSLKGQYSQQYGAILQLRQTLSTSGPLTVLQPGVAIPQTTSGFAPPSNPLIRLGVSALLGLLLGAALALLIERLDSRLRTREQVEDSFGLPVLAEIPTLPLGQRGKRTIVSADMPASATAEAHRSLRSAVLLLGPDGGLEVHGAHSSRPLVVLVTSALPGEGKSTTVANLATVMAEAGRRVLVLSFDLRNPRIHEYFEIENGVGVSDLLAPGSTVPLDDTIRPTRLNGVELVTSGQRLDHPGALLSSAGRLLEEARQRADVVLIDSAPMLSASDAVDLAQYIDVALVVSRLNRTTTTHAAATQRLLSRLGVPALGTVLVGSRPTGSQDGAYRFNGPVDHDRGRGSGFVPGLRDDERPADHDEHDQHDDRPGRDEPDGGPEGRGTDAIPHRGEPT